MNDKKYIRLKHPETNDFIAEYWVEENMLKGTKHGKPWQIDLTKESDKYYEQYPGRESIEAYTPNADI